MTSSWKGIAEAKRNAVISKIPPQWRLDAIPSAESEPNCLEILLNLCTPFELEIANSTVKKLSQDIAAGKYTSLSVTQVFCKRAAYLHQLTNCCSEIFFERAIDKAKELDQIFSKTKKVVGPLHGIPISLKDQLNIEGLDSAIGYVELVNKPIEKGEVSNLVRILEGLGAILFVKTTVPMAMMSPETVSNVYGRTVNSINRMVSCGGSSGGEGALVGGRGALLGFGTDIGGSIRIPSGAQGLYGLRCSSNRIPYCKISNSMKNAPIHCSVVGPMAVDLQDLKFIVKLILETNPWVDDPKCPPIPWREVNANEKAIFGYIDITSLSYVHPPVKRAMKEAKEALIKSGHEVVSITPPTSLLDLAAVSTKILLADGFKEIAEECKKSGEPIRSEILGLDENEGLPQESTISEYFNNCGKLYEFQQEFDTYLKHSGSLTISGKPIDAFFLPIQTCSAFKPGDSDIFSVFCTQVFNLLDYSVVTVPVTVSDQEVDFFEESYNPLNKMDEKRWKYYDPKLCHGSPIGIQVVSSRYGEEMAIAMAEVVSESLAVFHKASH
ncbi:uncharacterized protein PRCAT00004030001 [Priceomyces carsonii]|uniref:uncharacterized protein n=1 Tax=Priceomyces carsonii TaxID=28549 RepID=UPI002ED91F29|nr:unnamed protein product [Priceomyces carsonii]